MKKFLLSSLMGMLISTLAFGVDIKSQIGTQDLNMDTDGTAHGTFQRRTSTGGTITLDKIDGNQIPWSSAYTRTIRPKNITGDNTGNITGYDNGTFKSNITAPSIGSASYTDNGYFQDLITKGPWVDVRAYGAVGDNTTDDMAAIQAAATAAAGKTLVFPKPAVAYKVTGTITISSNTEIIGIGRPQIYTTSTTLPIFEGGAVSNVTITGLRLQGAGSGGASGNKGLIAINDASATGVSNIRIYENEVFGFRNGITALRVQNLWIERNVVHNFLLYGILASQSYNFHIDRNNVYTCDQTGAANAYGIMATGDEAGGKIQKRSSISFNKIDSINSWDGIMTHDANGLQIIGNDIRSVRTGIDVGHFDNTNIVKDITIVGNYIESTAVDTWAAAGAIHGGILVIGANSTYMVQDVIISGNIIKNFFSVTGLVASGDFSNITASFTKNATITGNAIVASGAQQGAAGIYIVGTGNGTTITGNSLQGTMAGGGIRIATGTASSVSISGNSINQDNVTDVGIYITGSTITGLALGENSTNVNAGYQLSVATSTITMAGAFFSGSATYDPASLIDAAGVTTSVTCTGAKLGDYAEASFSLDLQGIIMTAYVNSANNVSVRFQNETGGTIDLGSGTLRVMARPYGY